MGGLLLSVISNFSSSYRAWTASVTTTFVSTKSSIFTVGAESASLFMVGREGENAVCSKGDRADNNDLDDISEGLVLLDVDEMDMSTGGVVVSTEV